MSDTEIYLLALLIGSLWLKVILLFGLNRLVGPLIRTVASMISDIFSFLVLFFLVLLLFSCIGMILFDTVSDFSTFKGTIILLFSFSLGDFNFDTIQPEGGLGQVYVAIYLIVGLVILLNLLIAILSSTYARL